MSLMQIFTDPHIGKKMTANTSVKSRKRWGQALVQRCHDVINIGKADFDGVPTLCVGDLFDADQVQAADLLDGLKIALGCEMVLGGNHDVENSAGSVSALAVVSEVAHNVVMPVFNVATISRQWHGKAICVFVPHHTSKELFAEALVKAETEAKKKGEGQRCYLFLHCNYDCEYANKETELNLSPADAERLLAAGFNRIFIGHDHNRKSDFDGRVQVLGSVSPTSFGDCEAEHGHYLLDTVNDTLQYICTWDPKMQFLELTVGELMEQAEDETFGVQGILDRFPAADFIRINGDIEPSKAVEFSKTVKKLWIAADKAERLFAIKVDARVKAVKNFNEHGQRIDVLNLKAQIRMELENSPDLLTLWDELLEELT